MLLLEKLRERYHGAGIDAATSLFGCSVRYRECAKNDTRDWCSNLFAFLLAKARCDHLAIFVCPGVGIVIKYRAALEELRAKIRCVCV